MSRKQQTKIINPYQLNYRFQKHDGSWSEWHRSVGQWQDVELLQKQIRTLKMSKVNSSMEFEIIKDGHRIDYNANKTGETIKYLRK